MYISWGYYFSNNPIGIHFMVLSLTLLSYNIVYKSIMTCHNNYFNIMGLIGESHGSSVLWDSSVKCVKGMSVITHWRLDIITDVRALRIVSTFTWSSPLVGVFGVLRVCKHVKCSGCVDAEPWLLVHYIVFNYYDGAPLIRSSIRWTIQSLCRQYITQ